MLRPSPTLLLCFLISASCFSQPLPLDLVSSEYDDNGFPKNPKWGYQAMYSNDSLPGLAKLGISKNYKNWFTGKNPCTHDSLYIDPHKPPGCGMGHVNWFTVTYECDIFWKDHAFDDDYNFKLTRSDKALFTASSNWVYAEFDSDETVDLWKKKKKDWWDYFHAAVDSDDASAGILFNGKSAIVTGLFGLDCSHAGESELHPVYIMAIHLKEDETDDTWAFFVRNWGNEGWCGTSQHYLQTQTLKLRLPRAGAKNLSYNDKTRIHSSIKDYSFSTEIIPDTGAVLTFRLPPPEEHGWIEGELHIDWNSENPPLPSPADYPLSTIYGKLNAEINIRKNPPEKPGTFPKTTLGKGKFLMLFKRVW